MKVLVTGGVRSGKSRHAEELLASYAEVTYVAPGPTAAEDPDPDWVARIAAHQERRPAGWTTLETRDLAAALAVPGPVLVDCLGTWLTAVLGASSAWELPSADVHDLLDAALAPAAAALAAHPGPVVLVTNEVGLGVVPSHRSGRLFRDLLGVVNQRIATECDEVHLVVAGRILTI
jgi:adenosylcobinamide kinase / adenosylcobinamide-phosphate guanylyltransferase